MTALDIDTPHGPARAHLQPAPSSPCAALVLGHGAGGGVAAPDLVTAAGAGHDGGLFVVLVEQPYRVAGRRSVAPTHQLDAAWVAVVAALVAGPFAGLPVITGGRSSGARVACRTAAQTGASAVLCLAFPLHPPSRKPTAERKTRQPELDAVDVPTLVVQGASDPFGLPAPGLLRQVVTVPGNHGLRSHQDQIGAAIRAWLAELELSPELTRLTRDELADLLAARGRLPVPSAAIPVVAPGPVDDGNGGDPFGLTPRERQVIALVANGATNREIGAQLYMAEKTASVHVSRILAKLDVRSRTEAAAVAHRLGLGGDTGQ